MSTHTTEPTNVNAEYRRQVQAFHVHAVIAAGTLVFILGVNLMTNLSAGIAGEFTAWWSLWAVLGWSAGIGVHGLVVWLNRPTEPPI
ncbi:MAG: 2TM domain-containing protein [Actinomycetota bacterium]